MWQALGNTANFVDPFFGSGAVLLARPHAPGIETVNDKDSMLCVAPDTRILMGDLRWRRAGELQSGDQLIAFDEFNGSAREGLRAPTRYRHWRMTEITGYARTVKPCYRLRFDDNTEVTVSGDHQWLGGSHLTGGRGWRWVTTKNLVCNRKTQRSWILKLCDVVDQNKSWESGWLAGFYDGEGHLRLSPGWRINVSQKLGVELERAKTLLEGFGFEFNVSLKPRYSPKHNPCAHIELNGGMRGVLSFLMMTRPDRMIRKFQDNITNMSLYGRKHQAVGLIEKEFVGDQEVIAIQTDSHTYIAEGLASHNCNFWRSVRHDPEAVAYHADIPVLESEMHARHIWLVHQLADLVPKLEGNPDYYDAKIAGYWVYGICCWIGSEFCSGKGPWQLDDDNHLVRVGNDALGVQRKRVHLMNAGKGIHRQLVHLGNAGKGIHRQLVHLGNAGKGIHRQRVHLGDAGAGIHRQSVESVLVWMHALSERLARVRVCCGDWTRVLGPSVTVRLGLTGVLLDPPYSEDLRDRLYTSETLGVAKEVAKWAVENGDDPRLRIVFCGYENEHDMPSTWRKIAWKAPGGYGSQGNGRGKENANLERLWLSPHCLEIEDERQMALF